MVIHLAEKIQEKNCSSLITNGKFRIDQPLTSFTYRDRITLLGCVSSDGYNYKPCIELKVCLEPKPHAHGAPSTIRSLL